MKTQIIALFIFISGICYGQSTLETDSTRLSRERKEQLLNNYKLSNGDHPLDKNSSANNTPYNTEYNMGENTQVSDISVALPRYYEGPTENYSAAPQINPYANDYSFYQRKKVMDGGWINTSSSHFLSPTIGSLTLIRANYEYMLSEHIITSVGTYGARYFYNLNMYQDFGINASIRYQITDRLALIAFGQYSARSNINNIGGDNAWLIPNTNYGGVAEFKITKNFGVQGGIKREMNPMTGRWRNIPIFAPVIRLR